MRRTGLFIFGTGLSGFLIGGSGLDGAASAECMILTAASFLVAAVGYNIYKKSERGEKNKAAKEMKERLEKLEQQFSKLICNYGYINNSYLRGDS